MKSVVVVGLMFFSFLGFSQPVGPGIPSGSPLDGNLSFVPNLSSFTRVDYARIMIPDKKNEIKGNIYVFENWKNRGVLKIDKNEFKLSNINFNMRTNKIESRVGKDSVYIFDLTNVDHLFINNRKFKNYYLPKNSTNEIFELVYDGEEIKILKGYEIGVKRGEVDPLMVKKTVAKYYTTTRYYIKKGKNIEEIKLRKKNIVPLFNSKSRLVNDYAKVNKLSYKKEKDIIKLLNYYASN
jgi:hypothetical protein